MSLRIRTRSGEEIDLGEVREIYSDRLHTSGDDELIVALTDSLKAALSVRNKYDPQQDELHYDIADEALTQVRQAAGVIEEGA